jgi:hypothetical protein
MAASRAVVLETLASRHDNWRFNGFPRGQWVTDQVSPETTQLPSHFYQTLRGPGLTPSWLPLCTTSSGMWRHAVRLVFVKPQFREPQNVHYCFHHMACHSEINTSVTAKMPREECRLLGYRNPVCTSQATHYVSATILVFTAVTMKNAVFWYVTPCGYCKNRVSEERSASIITVTRIGEFLRSMRRLLVTANDVPSSLILVILMMEALRSPKRRFLQEPRSITSQKTAFFIITAVKNWNLARISRVIIPKSCLCLPFRPSLAYNIPQAFSTSILLIVFFHLCMVSYSWKVNFPYYKKLCKDSK